MTLQALRRLAAAALAACAAAVVVPERDAGAQQWLIGGAASASSGVEGGGATGTLYRTRSRLRVGVDLRVDEFPEDIFEFGALAEIEPRSGFGADVRYARAAGEHFVLDIGLLGILAPSSLYGACAGMTYRLPISKKTQITVGPEGD
ncbi:MAG: hypothetical protein JOZ69_16805, partial [Myxococcales bacterium]|nr:hypothetical protein [Myxococcales bacterium]